MERATQQSSAADHARQDFLAILSHELRGPLTLIQLSASLLEVYTDLPDVVDAARMIADGVKQEVRMIDDLLDFMRLFRDVLCLDMQSTDVHEVILAAIEAYSPRRRISI